MTTEKVADFTLPTNGGGSFTLSAQLGKTVVLYFYPKDNTPGCTTEGQDFAALHADFEKANAVVVGVSRDSVKSHDNFCAKFGFPFALISDADEALCTQFEVIKMKNMYGKQVRGIERSTFIIDSAGKLAQAWRGVKVAGHAAAVLNAVHEINAR
ncbi:MAG TPA: peroxiredoxin [Casimicrobium sp.]|jgi:peroxiredoxin Q/BCP|nr:peroxiredoxin [Casimicrobium sp.]